MRAIPFAMIPGGYLIGMAAENIVLAITGLLLVIVAAHVSGYNVGVETRGRNGNHR